MQLLTLTREKAFYELCVKNLNVQSLAVMEEFRWTEFFGPDVFLEGSWRPLYKLPIEKWTADLQWRVVRGAIATNRYRVHLDPKLREECIFSSQRPCFFSVLVCQYCVEKRNIHTLF